MANDILKKKIVEAAKKELGGLVAENIDGIMKSYQETLESSTGDKFVFQVPCALMLSPDSDGVKVRAKIGYGVKHTDESIGTTATTQPDLFDKKKAPEKNKKEKKR